MSTSSAQTRLEQMFREIFWNIETPVAEMTRLNNPNWDSLSHMSLVLMFEQEFGVELTDEEVIEFNSFEVGLEILREKLTAKT